MFGIDDAAMAAVIGAGIQGGSSLLGGMFGASGQAATNAAQIQHAIYQQQGAQNFNAGQAWENRKFQAEQTEYQMQYNRQERLAAQAFNDAWAGRQMNFQEQMSSSAYQRAMSDMYRAGLNPILAANLGGASSPGGSAASIAGASGGAAGGSAASSSPVQASLRNPAAAMQAGITSAGQMAQTYASIRSAGAQAGKDDSQTDLNKQNVLVQKANEALTEELAKKARQDTATSAAQARQADASARNQDANALNAAVQNAILGHGVTSAAGEARIKTREAEDVEKYGSGPIGSAGAAGSRIGFTLRRIIGEVIDKFNEGTPPAAAGPGGRAPWLEPGWKSPNKWWR